MTRKAVFIIFKNIHKYRIIIPPHYHIYSLCYFLESITHNLIRRRPSRYPPVIVMNIIIQREGRLSPRYFYHFIISLVGRVIYIGFSPQELQYFFTLLLRKNPLHNRIIQRFHNHLLNGYKKIALNLTHRFNPTPMFLPCCPKTDEQLTVRPLPPDCRQG